MSDVFDLLVRVKKELVQLSPKHPAARNAFIYGVWTGLTLGNHRMLSGLSYINENLIDVLTDLTTTVSDVLNIANNYLPEGWLFYYEMFLYPDYRSSQFGEEYNEGLRLGFRYVFQLFNASSEFLSGDKLINFVSDRVIGLKQQLITFRW